MSSRNGWYGGKITQIYKVKIANHRNRKRFGSYGKR